MNKGLTGLFTSESVSPGHPDKICDLIADTILDEYLKQDKESHVAVEALIGDGYIVIGGNIKSKGVVNIDKVVRNVLKEIGYVSTEIGCSYSDIEIINHIDKQSEEIDNAVINCSINDLNDLGAGDQGMVFGYASNETEEFMPLAITLSHKLVKRATELFHNGTLEWARPDMKSQVTINYVDGHPKGIDTIIMSVQHNPDISKEIIKEDIINKVILPIIRSYGFNHADKYLINSSGSFIIGGPKGDTGLTGRKIIVDTYGGYSKHGGGAFSGKDPSKVDRSGAYMARYIAKNLVASGVTQECQVQIAYAIGVSQPVSINVETFNTSSFSEETLVDIIKNIFDLRPKAIIEHFDLLNPIYHLTTNYGHFGKSDSRLKWENTDKVPEILDFIKRIK